MTFERGINSKHKSRDFLKRGLKSMFPNYDEPEQTAPPVDTDTGRKEQSTRK